MQLVLRARKHAPSAIKHRENATCKVKRGKITTTGAKRGNKCNRLGAKNMPLLQNAGKRETGSKREKKMQPVSSRERHVPGAKSMKVCYWCKVGEIMKPAPSAGKTRQSKATIRLVVLLVC